MRVFIVTLLVASLAGVPAVGRILHVPAEYATIQSAANEVQDGDTILVAEGVYGESVALPARIGLLKGDVLPSHPRPILDPSPLEGSSSMSCLWTLQGQWTVEDFVFRNGPQMYPHHGCGGVYADRQTRLRRCLFDSTYQSIESYSGVVLEECRFVDVQGEGIYPTTPNITASDCEFTGNCRWAVVWCGDSCLFERCWFHDNQTREELVFAYGNEIVFRDCLFEPYQLYGEPPLRLGGGRAVFEDNMFLHCHQNWPIVQVICACSHPTEFRGNKFLSDGPPDEPSGSGWVIEISCAGGDSCYGALFEDNIFFDGDSAVGPIAVIMETGGRFYHNRFTRVQPDTQYAALQIEMYEPNRTTVTCQDNLFYGNGLAITNASVATDARWNWWGDSTGPYNATLNPEGRGDEVSDSVDFIPWHQDTAFFNEATPERFMPTVQQVSLAVYPNPFNTTARLTLRLPEPAIVRVELFDLLGRRVREVWSGAVAYWQDISLNAGDLPSGLYFARVTNTLTRTPLATTKLVLLK